jgi:hypothetical protein
MSVAETESSGWPYLGVGCLMAVIGFTGGGMIAVLVAKVVGAIRGCTPAAETGAPCAWTTFWAWGALIGLIVLPSIGIWRMRRGRQRQAQSATLKPG